jgi:hypothetical protein
MSSHEDPLSSHDAFSQRKSELNTDILKWIHGEINAAEVISYYLHRKVVHNLSKADGTSCVLDWPFDAAQTSPNGYVRWNSSMISTSGCKANPAIMSLRGRTENRTTE